MHRAFKDNATASHNIYIALAQKTPRQNPPQATADVNGLLHYINEHMVGDTFRECLLLYGKLAELVMGHPAKPNNMRPFYATPAHK